MNITDPIAEQATMSAQVRQGLKLYYRGSFDQLTISQLVAKIQSYYSFHRFIGQKLTSIFIELSQNIAFYSSERAFGTHIPNKHSGIGLVMLSETGNQISMVFSNLIGEKSYQILSDRFEKIKSMNLEQLRELRKNLREGRVTPQTSGGNFGLIQIAILSRNQISTEIKYISAQTYLYSITIKLEIR